MRAYLNKELLQQGVLRFLVKLLLNQTDTIRRIRNKRMSKEEGKMGEIKKKTKGAPLSYRIEREEGSGSLQAIPGHFQLSQCVH